MIKNFSLALVRRVTRIRFEVCVILAAFFISLFLFLTPQPEQKILVTIPQGTGVMESARILAREGIVRSPFFFLGCVVLHGGNVVAGIYEFDERSTACEVGKRFAQGKYGLVQVKITIPEGTHKWQIAELFENFPNFDKEKFLREAPEGYLFPETYYFLPDVTEEDVISVMNEEFKKRIEPLLSDIEKSGKSLNEIVTMASLLEEEANSPESKGMISDILWRRISIGMPLQVDAAFSYVNGENTYQLSLDDLNIDSPYNTYRYKGLPPTPIANPGITALKAALYPTKNNYLYFLSDLRGRMYYARDFAGHQENRLRYLRR